MGSTIQMSRPLVRGVLPTIDDDSSPDMPGDERFAFCRGKLLLDAPDDAEIIPCTSLSDPDVFADIIARYTCKFPGADKRAVISMWTLYYFSILTIAPTVHRLVHRRQLSLGLSQLSLVCDPQTAEPKAFLLSGPGRPADHAPALADLHAILRDHAAPVITLIAGHCGVAPKLMWNNVAVYLNWIIKEIGNQAGPNLMEEAIEIISSQHWPDGSRNPLFGMIKLARRQCGMDHFQRKVCCLRYNLPGVPGCGDLCPLPDGRR